MVFESNEINLVKIQDGTDGIPGQDGQTLYTWVKYSQYSDGTNLTDDSSNATYIGFAYNKESQTESTNKEDYVWSRIKGEQGIQGIQGVAGQNGESTYFYVRYSVNSDGTNMTESPNSESKYMGVCSTTSTNAPTNKTSYTWSLIKGMDGQNGSPGEKGDDGQSSYLHIKYSDNGTTFTSNSGETIGKYIGTYVDYIEADSTTFSDYTWKKFVGEDGVSAKSLDLYATTYAVPFNADNTAKDSTVVTLSAEQQNYSDTITWSTTPSITLGTVSGDTNKRTIPTSAFTNNQKIQVSITSGGLTDTATIVKVKDGSDGVNGQNGANGTSITVASTSVMYQKSSSGTTAPTGTWSSSVVTADLGGYLWTRTVVTYSDGTSTTSYSVSYRGTNGSNGTSGTSVTVSSTSITYQSSTSGTATPTGTWLTSIPTVANGSYLWTKTVVSYSDGKSTTAYSVARQGANGSNGTNGISATTVWVGNEAQTLACGTSRTTTSACTITIPFGAYIGTTKTACSVSYSTLPSGVTLASNTAGTTSTDGKLILNVASGANLGGTSATYDNVVITLTITANGLNFTKYIALTKSIQGATGNTGATGSSGLSVTKVQTQYYLSTSSTTQSGGSWSNTCPTWITGKYLWKRDTTTLSNNSVVYSTAVRAKDIEDNSIVNWCHNNDKTLIDGGYIYADSLSAISANLGTVTAGVIKSTNYNVTNGTGMMLNLNTGTWDSKYTQIDSTGKLTCSNLTVNSGTIDSAGIIGGYLQSQNYVAEESGMKLDLLTGSWDSKYTQIDSTGKLTCESAIINGKVICKGILNVLGGSWAAGEFIPDGASYNITAFSNKYYGGMKIDGVIYAEQDLISHGDVYAGGSPGSGDEVSLMQLNSNLIKYHVTTVSAINGTITVPKNSSILSVQNCGAASSNDAITSWQRTSETTLYYNKIGSNSTVIIVLYLLNY